MRKDTQEIINKMKLINRFYIIGSIICILDLISLIIFLILSTIIKTTSEYFNIAVVFWLIFFIITFVCFLIGVKIEDNIHDKQMGAIQNELEETSLKLKQYIFKDIIYKMTIEDRLKQQNLLLDITIQMVKSKRECNHYPSKNDE